MYGDDDETSGPTFDPTLRECFKQFDSKKDYCLRQAEQAIFLYYQEVCGEYRDQLGKESADQLMPIIENISQLKGLIRPTTLFLKSAFSKHQRIAGLLFDCTWETSLGLAVKFVDEVIEGVGPQDIAP